eukprot:COSAG06_NODE_45496_length_354_cov_0.937255_1_plen_22_part_10
MGVGRGCTVETPGWVRETKSAK